MMMMLKVHFLCMCVCGEGGGMLKFLTAIFQLFIFLGCFNLHKTSWFGLKVVIAGEN